MAYSIKNNCNNICPGCTQPLAARAENSETIAIIDQITGMEMRTSLGKPGTDFESFVMNKGQVDSILIVPSEGYSIFCDECDDDITDDFEFIGS